MCEELEIATNAQILQVSSTHTHRTDRRKRHTHAYACRTPLLVLQSGSIEAFLLMPNRHLGHTSSQQAQPLLSGGRDPPEQPGFSTSQVSSSSTLVDGSLNPGNPGGGLPSQPHGHHHRQHSSLGSAVTASSPMRIPGERTHNRHNLSSSSAQSNATLSNSNPNSHSPSPRTHTRHPSLDRIAAFDAHERQTSVLSSNYALGVVFEQFEHVADKKMNLILNMGVVSPRTTACHPRTDTPLGCRSRLLQDPRARRRPYL